MHRLIAEINDVKSLPFCQKVAACILAWGFAQLGEQLELLAWEMFAFPWWHMDKEMARLRIWCVWGTE